MPQQTPLFIPAGTQSPVMFITPETSLFACPTVLGGTVLVETSPTPANGPWLAWGPGNSSAGASVRPLQNQYARVTAVTAAAFALMSNVGGANQPFTSQNLVSSNGTCASPSATTEQILFSVRIPPGFLPLNFRIQCNASFNMTNNANVKSVAFRLNGVAGTSFFTSPSLASQANYNAIAAFVGQGSAALKGVGAGASGGLGVSTTAFTTLAYDFINNELEVVVTATKATGTDTLTLESLSISLY